jgi:putative membrane protein
MGRRKKADNFFTPEEKQRIKGAILDVERYTMGEVAVMVVDRSSLYVEAEILGGLFLGSFIALIATAVYLDSSLWLYIPLSFFLFFPCRVLFRRMSHIGAAFIGKKRKEGAVKERALKAFYEKGLYRTKGQTGVLFFLSLLERKVWVLADKGIHEKIEQQRLNRIANLVSVGVRGGRACEALIEAIGEVGELLRLHFPAEPGNVDELPDDVICGSDVDCKE